jgi:hypothetical protein
MCQKLEKKSIFQKFSFFQYGFWLPQHLSNADFCA